MQQPTPQQMLANMKHCYAKELAFYEGVRKIFGNNLQMTGLLSKAVENLRVVENSENSVMDECHLLFARFTFVEMYQAFRHQLEDEGINADENPILVINRLISFMACTPQEELEYLFQGNFQDCSLTQLLNV